MHTGLFSCRVALAVPPSYRIRLNLGKLEVSVEETFATLSSESTLVGFFKFGCSFFLSEIEEPIFLKESFKSLANVEEIDLWYFHALTDLSVSSQSQTTRGTMS